MSPAADYRTITDLDHVRIFNLLRRQGTAGQLPAQAEALAELIDAADQVPPQQIAGDIVTMYSKLRVSDADGANERRLTLCYPADADVAQGMISVLSPLGTALLGHPFWNMVDPERSANMTQFLKNLSIMGGMLLLAVSGPGRFSVDGR